MQVWKFPLEAQGAVMMPAGAQVVHAASQDGRATVWALVDPTATPEPRAFLVKGTGHDVPPHCHHVGTYFTGPFVWHVFEQRNPAERPWIEWAGGEAPTVGSLLVDVQFRDGSPYESVPVAALTWGWNGEAEDIVRYREATSE